MFPCDGLSDAPTLSEIETSYSAVLGDVFHAMDRTRVPVKHEAKKAFFVALREAYLMWNEDKIEELKGNMKAAGMTEEQIKDGNFFSSALYHRCVDRRASPNKQSYV